MTTHKNLNDMIKANELRIGNWVYMGKIPARVSHIKEDYCWTDEAGSGMYVFVEPILLTAEILEKAGFKVQYTNGGFLCWQKEDFKLLDRRLPYPQYHAPAAAITSLHQLQNLYFALTGTELNITL